MFSDFKDFKKITKLLTEDSVPVFDQFLFLAYLISDSTRYLDRKSVFLGET